MRDRVLLIDGLNQIYRGNVAFKPRPGVDSTHVVTYNLFRNLRALIELFDPTRCFFVLEGRGNFRHGIDPTYKANRIVKRGSVENQAGFDAQRDEIIRLLPLLPIYTVWADGFEADDVIGHLAHDLRDEDTIIVSNDKDYQQLLQQDLPGLRLYNSHTKLFVEAPAYHFVTFLSLAGDTSDNIRQLIDSVTAALVAANPEALTEYLSDPLRAEAFNHNRRLVEFRGFDADHLRFTEPAVDWSRLYGEFRQMGFKSLTGDEQWKRFRETFDRLS